MRLFPHHLSPFVNPLSLLNIPIRSNIGAITLVPQSVEVTQAVRYIRDTLEGSNCQLLVR